MISLFEEVRYRLFRGNDPTGRWNTISSNCSLDCLTSSLCGCSVSWLSRILKCSTRRVPLRSFFTRSFGFLFGHSFPETSNLCLRNLLPIFVADYHTIQKPNLRSNFKVVYCQDLEQMWLEPTFSWDFNDNLIEDRLLAIDASPREILRLIILQNSINSGWDTRSSWWEQLKRWVT